jgi:multimeric flavodoxin WrbA
MNTLILKGSPPTGHQEFNHYIEQLEQNLSQTSGKAEVFNLNEMNIHYCTGCWSCWLKTPGKCIFQDDMEQIYPKMVTADLVIYASPLTMGFIHSTLKKIMDRHIPMALPYIGFYRGECHHYLRYPKTPAFAVLVEKEKSTDTEDLEIVTQTFQRLSLNFRTRLIFSKTTETSLEVILDEISHI